MPGKVWVGELPNDLSDINENNQIKLVPLKEDLLKNHGYCRVEKDGVMSGIVGTENGIFKVTGRKGRRVDRRNSDRGSGQRYDLR